MAQAHSVLLILILQVQHYLSRPVCYNKFVV